MLCGMQADFTLRRLQQLKERIMGTECLVAIELDSRRNELVALNLVCIISFVNSQIAAQTSRLLSVAMIALAL